MFKFQRPKTQKSRPRALAPLKLTSNPKVEGTWVPKEADTRSKSAEGCNATLLSLDGAYHADKHWSAELDGSGKGCVPRDPKEPG